MVCQCRVSQEGVGLETKLTNAEVSKKKIIKLLQRVRLTFQKLSSDLVGCMCGFFLGNPGPITLF